MLNKNDLKKLAELSRIDIPLEEESKLLKDLKMILKHFEELKEVNTSNVEPQSGGSFNVNILREDEETFAEDNGQFVESFPEFDKKGNLIVPPIFD